MPLTDSRLGPGTLKLGTTEYGAQVTKVSLAPSLDSRDGVPTLADPEPLPTQTERWNLEGTVIQDFGAPPPNGFVNYVFDNSGAEVAFEWIPDDDEGTTWSGTCLLSAVPIGGDAGVQITSDFTFACKGKPTREANGARAAARKGEK